MVFVSVEGKQLILGINHKRILLYIICNGLFESVVIIITILTTPGGSFCISPQELSIEMVLVWKSFLYFLGGILAFSVCLVKSRGTLIRQRLVFNSETYRPVEGVIDIRGHYIDLIRECIVGILMCSAFLVRALLIQFVHDSVSQSWILISLIIQTISAIFLKFTP